MIYVKFYYDAEINYFKIKQINKFFLFTEQFLHRNETLPKLFRTLDLYKKKFL